MTLKVLLRNTDAVSVSIGFILMFAVTVLVFSALIISFYTLSSYSEKAAMQENFKIVASNLAIKINIVDNLLYATNSNGGTVNDFEYEFSMSTSVAGKSYVMNITNTTRDIIMEADNGARITVPFNVTNNFIERKIYSGAENYKFKYNQPTGSVEIEEQ